MRLRIRSREVRTLLNAPPPDLPTYVSPILNLANRFAQGTRPKVVGQMSQLIQEFDGRTLEQWAAWYQQRYPEKINEAAKLIPRKISEFQRVLNSITDDMIQLWVRDLVLVKTFVGLRFHEAILKRVSEALKKSYTLATPDQEAQGVDGTIGDIGVSIKAMSWRDQVIQPEPLPRAIIYYRKTADGLEIEFNPDDFGSH